MKEVEALINLSNKAQEALKYISLHFLFGRLAIKTDAQLKRLAHSTTERRSYEISMAHKHGFDQHTIQQQLGIMHQYVHFVLKINDSKTGNF